MTGNVTVAIINKDQSASGLVKITVPKYNSSFVKRMLVPSLGAKEGITIGGQTFDGSKDSKAVGKESSEKINAQKGVFFKYL